MKDVKVIDNFLNTQEYNSVINTVVSKNFPWYISDESDYPGDKNAQLFHILYNNNIPYSNYFDKFQPIYDKLKIFSLFKVRLIATMKYNGKDNMFHTDLENVDLFKVPTKTAIFYLNSNDGGTEFEHNNQIVNSVSNRMIVFPSYLKHRTIKHKDEEVFRYVLNLNYVDIC